LREIEGVVPDGVEDKILQLVDNMQQVFAKGRHDDEGMAVYRTLCSMARTDARQAAGCRRSAD